MPSKRSITYILAATASLLASTNGFAPTSTPLSNAFRLSETDLQMAKGRRSLRKTVKDSNNSRGVSPMGGEMEPAKKTNWVPVKGITSMTDLPKGDNEVKLVDTMADQLMNGATNPTGAVSIINYDGKTYCFSSSCSACKIPLTKAKVLEPNEETGNTTPRLSCEFCQATYNIRTGERVQNVEKAGFSLGGVVSGLFGASDKVALPTYDLGEKSGQVLINLP
jgi:nitrite reductase/ring-hydroxylating ferredoxin subunit